jgi:hypothetical protein
MSQQVWCWGCDISRPKGNWLVEYGFERIPPPADRESESSVYTLKLPNSRCVVLRGFGVFYGDAKLGGIFLPRYQFRPRCTPLPELENPPWSDTDLPEISPPNAAQKEACATLVLELIDWIQLDEHETTERLGMEYRRNTLITWNNGERPFIPAASMVVAWRELSNHLAVNSCLCFEQGHANTETSEESFEKPTQDQP